MARKGRVRAVDSSLARRYAKAAREALDGAVSEQQAGRNQNAAKLFVNASIRASDALCIAALGSRSAGEDHRTAIDLLRSIRPVGPELAQLLESTLAGKAELDYGIEEVGPSSLKSLMRHAQRLVEEAEARSP